MNKQACRDALKINRVNRDRGAHAGLLLSRYLQVPVQDEEKTHPQERCALHKSAIDAVKAAESVYKPAYERRCQHLQQIKPYEDGVFTVEGRLIVGLGGENVLETGITLHHTYGVPIIPGPALKGLASHYCDQVWGGTEPEFKLSGVPIEDETRKNGFRQGGYHRAIFGANDDSGHIIFHDAWITHDTVNNSLVLDVMTPHHGDYYAEERDDQTSELLPPTDFDNPNPVTFLSVTGAFHVAISCDVAGEQGEKWVNLAFKLLTDAIKHWGVGGKTNAGYGRLKKEPKPDGPPPKTKPDEQAVWLKEMSEDGELMFATEEDKEVYRNKSDVQGVGKKSPLTVGKWYVLFGTRSVKLPGR